MTPPTLTAPAVATNEMPVLPEAVILAEVVTVVPVTAMPPFAESAAVIETAPVAGIDMFPPAVVVIELETVVAAAFMVTGPATDIVPPEIVTPEVLLVLPIRRLEGGPAKVKLLFVNVLANEAAVDSNTTAPVVFTVRVDAAEILFPITVTLPLAVELLVAPKLWALVFK